MDATLWAELIRSPDERAAQARGRGRAAHRENSQCGPPLSPVFGQRVLPDHPGRQPAVVWLPAELRCRAQAGSDGVERGASPAGTAWRGRSESWAIRGRWLRNRLPESLTFTGASGDLALEDREGVREGTQGRGPGPVSALQVCSRERGYLAGVRSSGREGATANTGMKEPRRETSHIRGADQCGQGHDRGPNRQG